jgi:hypothetical protein
VRDEEPCSHRNQGCYITASGSRTVDWLCNWCGTWRECNWFFDFHCCMPQIPGLKQRFFFFAKMRIHIHTKLTMLNLKCHGNICEVTKNKLSILAAQHSLVDDGSHNVSRWMTWLPISLKNAVKCDKWYQLQNLSITESLNANGAWKQGTCVPTPSMPVSVSNKNQNKQADSVLGWRESKEISSQCGGSLCARLRGRYSGANLKL